MKNRIYFAQDDDIIDIRRDNVFKAVFARETKESRTALSRLVSALIGREMEVTRIAANEPPADGLGGRNIRFDINCVAEDGEPVNVEMSLNPDPCEPVRLEYYAGRLFTGQDIRGIKKDYDDLKRAYQIALLAKKRFFDDGEFFHAFEYYDPANKVSLNGKSRIITVELSKLGKVVEKPAGEMSPGELWAVFIGYLTDKSKRAIINDIVKREEGIAMAGKVLVTISKDQIERARLLSEYKYEVDLQSQVVYAERQGMKKGIEIGRAEGQRRLIDLLRSGKTLDEAIAILDAGAE